MENKENGVEDYADDPVIAQQAQLMMNKTGGKKKPKCEAKGRPFDSASHEIEKQAKKATQWSLIDNHISYSLLGKYFFSGSPFLLL